MKMVVLFGFEHNLFSADPKERGCGGLKGFWAY